MGQRGKLKLPQHLQAVPANADGHAYEPTAADRTQPGAPDKPIGFPDDDAELEMLWDELVGELDEAGLIARCDALTVELAVRHFLAARKASDALRAGEIVLDDAAHGGTQKKNPAGAEFRSQSALFLEYCKQLGMSFVSRARVPAKDGDGGGANPFTPTGSG